MPKIHSVVFDSTNTKSDLCEMGATCCSDKSPYNKVTHRHPYTALYALLFSRFREQPVRFAEIGIAGGASMIMWRHYFRNAATKIFAFDRDTNFIANLERYNLFETHGIEMDVKSESSIHQALMKTGGELDVLLDDSTHDLEDQVKIVRAALQFIKPGGMIVIEDIFRRIPDEDYENAMGDLLDHFAFCCFYVTDHIARWSPDWDNDKVLVLIKK